MDPVFLAFLSALGGAGLTAVAGLVTAIVQSKREHSKWVRERRFEAYRAFLIHVEEQERFGAELQAAAEGEKIPKAWFEEARQRISQAQAETLGQLKLLGPPALERAAGRFLHAISGTNDEEYRKSRADFVGQARKELGIS